MESFRANHRGTGDKQFPLHMMLALLIYSDANGLFSSRKIERATHRDGALRYLTAGSHPDHDTICQTALTPCRMDFTQPAFRVL